MSRPTEVVDLGVAPDSLEAPSSNIGSLSLAVLGRGPGPSPRHEDEAGSSNDEADQKTMGEAHAISDQPRQPGTRGHAEHVDDHEGEACQGGTHLERGGGHDLRRNWSEPAEHERLRYEEAGQEPDRPRGQKVEGGAARHRQGADRRERPRPAPRESDSGPSVCERSDGDVAGEPTHSHGRRGEQRGPREGQPSPGPAT